MRGLDRLGDQVRGAADSHQVDRLVLADRLDRCRAAFGLADHAQQPSLRQHLLGELVHAGGGGRASRAHHLVAHRVDRANVVDETPTEIHRQRLAGVQHLGDALVRSVAAGQHLAVQQQHIARFPARHLSRRHAAQVDTLALAGVVRQTRPVGKAGRVQVDRARAVEHEVRMPRRRTVGDHADRQTRGVGRVILDLNVEDGGQAAEPLRADAERIDLLKELDAQLLDAVLRAAGDQLLHVDRVHQRFLGEHRGLLGGTADADAEHAGRAPAGAHRRDSLEHPVDN